MLAWLLLATIRCGRFNGFGLCDPAGARLGAQSREFVAGKSSENGRAIFAVFVAGTVTPAPPSPLGGATPPHVGPTARPGTMPTWNRSASSRSVRSSVRS
jgi:hypothetical protein